MILGIDVGSQSLKAVLLDDALRPIGSGRRGYAIDFPQPGWAEQSPAVWEAGARPGDRRGAGGGAAASPAMSPPLGIAGQLDGCIAVDAAAAALAPCLIWMDRRADDGSRRSPRHRRANEFFRARTGANLDGSHMAPKMRWLLDHAGASSGRRDSISR